MAFLGSGSRNVLVFAASSFHQDRQIGCSCIIFPKDCGEPNAKKHALNWLFNQDPYNGLLIPT